MSATATPIEPRHEVDDSTSVPPGYKQSDIGVIPNDWEVAEIGDSNPFVTSGSRGWATFYSDIGSAFLRITNISRESIYPNLNDLKFVNIPPGVSEGIRTHLEDGDVLISITADIGIIGYVNARVAKPAYINQHIALVRFDPDKIDGQFVSYFLASGASRKLFRALTDQGAKAGMSLLTVRRIRFARPPASEQHAIAAALADVDELIGALEKLIAKKRAIKQGAMQQLLSGRARLRGFAEDSVYKRTDAGLMPADWESVPLGELFTFKNGLNKAKRYFGFGTPIVNYMDVFGRPWLQAGNLIGRVSLTQAEIKNFSVQRGDVFFTRTSETVEEVGMTSVMLDDPCDTVFSGFVLRARPKDERLDNQYKKYCFSTWSVHKQVVSKATYTTRALTNGRLLSAVCIARPPIEEQRAIAAVLSDMDAEIAALERRRDKTKAIKLGMTQLLLTGRVRLVKPENKA